MTPVTGSSFLRPAAVPIAAAPALTEGQELAVFASALTDTPVQREDLIAQQRREQVRKDLALTLLKKFELPEQTPWTRARQAWVGCPNEIKFKTMTQCFLLGFFDDLVRRCNLPVNAIEMVMGFLKFLQNNPFAKDNGKRLQAVLNHLRLFPQVRVCLEENEAKEFLQGMKFFLTAPENNQRSLGDLRNLAQPVEKKPLEICRYLRCPIEIILRRTFAIIDAEIALIKQRFDPRNAKKEFVALSKLPKNKMPPAFSEIIHQNKVFYERMERMIRVYAARKKFLWEQYQTIELLLEENPAVISSHLPPLLIQFSKDLKLLCNQIDTLKQTCDERLEQCAICLKKDDLLEIEKTEKQHIFSPDQTIEEKKEERALFATQMGAMVNGLMSMAISETNPISELSATRSQEIAQLCDMTTQLRKQAEDLVDRMKRLEQEKKTDEQLHRKQVEKEKQKMPEAKVRQIEQEVAMNYRLVFQLSLVLGSFQDSLSVLESLLSVLEEEIQGLPVPEPLPASSQLAPLFRKLKVRHPRPEKVSAVEPTLPPPVEFIPSPELIRIPSPEPPEPLAAAAIKKASLEDLFTQQQACLLSGSNLEKASSLLSIEHTRLHLGTLRSAAHFLNLHQGPLPQAIVFSIVRSCSLVTEQALTAKALSQGIDISHDHIDLAEGLGLPVPALLNTLRHGVIFHRYPCTSKLYLQEHSFTIPLALQWLLKEKEASSENLLELISETFATLKAIFPRLPEIRDLQDHFSSSKQQAPGNHSFSSSFQEKLKTPSRAFDRCAKILDPIEASNVNDPLRAAICGDIRFSLQCLNSALASLIQYPHTAVLATLGDATLTLVQFLDEHIEKLWHLHTCGFVRLSHDLEGFRASRDYQESPEHQRILAELNIGYGAQYPHRYLQETQTSPGAIIWRLDTEKMASHGERLDREAVQFEKDKKAGFNAVKKRTKQAPVQQHSLFATHDQLFEFVIAEAAMAEKRLSELKKLAHNNRDDN
jgi:hypothetical protein